MGTKEKAKFVYYFYSPTWDDMNYKKRNAFVDECRKLNLKCETIDVDSENGATFSCRMGVRNVPTAIFMHHGKVVGIEKGNNAHESIAKYI